MSNVTHCVEGTSNLCRYFFWNCSWHNEILSVVFFIVLLFEQTKHPIHESIR